MDATAVYEFKYARAGFRSHGRKNTRAAANFAGLGSARGSERRKGSALDICQLGHQRLRLGHRSCHLGICRGRGVGTLVVSAQCGAHHKAS